MICYIYIFFIFEFRSWVTTRKKRCGNNVITATFGFCPRSLSGSDGVLKQKLPKSEMHILS